MLRLWLLTFIYVFKANEDHERDFKTSSDHWDVILNYPLLLTPKFGRIDGDNAKIKEMWEQMIGILNSLGHGQRSVQKWKEVNYRED